MAYIQYKTPLPNRIYNFSLRNFVGGLNNRSEQLQVNESPDLLNMVFADDTVMEKRHGQEYYDEVKLSNPITYIDEFKPYTEADKEVRATDTKFYIDGVEVATTTSRINGCNFQGKYFFVDGNKLRVYGKFAQSSTTYEKITGTPINNYVVLDVVSSPSDYTPLGEEHTQGVLNIDYTNKKIWYEPCKFEKEDTYLGVSVVPEKPKYIVSHNGRLFVSGSEKDDDNIFITHDKKPYYFPPTLPMQIPPDSDKVKGLIVYDNSVIVGREKDIYALTGVTNRTDFNAEPFKLYKLNTHTGVVNQDCMKIAHNYLFFLGSDGNAYSLTAVRNDVRVLATTILSKTIDFKKKPIFLTHEDLFTATSYFFDDEWYISIKDKVLIYSYRHRAWTMLIDLNARSFYDKSGVLYWGNDEGRTVKFSEDYYDFGQPFQAYWKSRYFDMDEASVQKLFRQFYLVAHIYNEYMSDINVTFEIDYTDVQGRVVVENKISIWGLAKWGDRFISRNIVESLPFLIGRRGRAISFKFSNGYKPSGGSVTTKDELLDYPGKTDYLLVWVEDEEKYYLYYEYEWYPMSDWELNQAMKIYQVNGEYEFRGKRN